MNDTQPESPRDRMTRQISFIAEVDRLKDVTRQTLTSRSRRPENDAEHSWHLCLSVLVLAEHANRRDLDLLRVLRMLIIHDIVEIDAGDTFAYDDAARVGQRERESVAADRLFGLLPSDQAAEFRGLWEEFEDRKTPESRFAAAVDRFQPMLMNCLTEGAAWRRHGITHDRVMARNAHIADGSSALWEHTVRMLDRAMADGTLEPAPGNA